MAVFRLSKWFSGVEKKKLFNKCSYLHEVVIDTGQAMGGTHVLLLVPLVHQRALVLHPQPPAEVLA